MENTEVKNKDNYTKGPWIEEVEEIDVVANWDREEKAYAPTGWIKNVVRYESCGSHRAEWLNRNDKLLALAAPLMYEALLKLASRPLMDFTPEEWDLIQKAIPDLK